MSPLPLLLLLLRVHLSHLAPWSLSQNTFLPLIPYQNYYPPVYTPLAAGYQNPNYHSPQAYQSPYQPTHFQTGYQTSQDFTNPYQSEIYKTDSFQLNYQDTSFQPAYPSSYQNYQSAGSFYPLGPYLDYPDYQGYQGYQDTSFTSPLYPEELPPVAWGPEEVQAEAVPQAAALKAELDTPAWQGKVGGVASTRCHDGRLLPFRARCNSVAECSGGEDEWECDWHKGSAVQTLTGFQNLKQLVAAEENVLLEFFAPWCPACVTFLPELEAIQANLGGRVKVVKINTDDDPEMKEMFNVTTYPRVLLWAKQGEGESPHTFDKKKGMQAGKVLQWVESIIS